MMLLPAPRSHRQPRARTRACPSQHHRTGFIDTVVDAHRFSAIRLDNRRNRKLHMRFPSAARRLPAGVTALRHNASLTNRPRRHDLRHRRRAAARRLLALKRAA